MATLAPSTTPLSPWASIARAMTVTGGVSLAASLLNLATMKILAVVLGPAQVAVFTTLLQVRLTALTASTLNGQTALVRGIATGGGGAYARTVFALMTFAALLTCCMILVFAPALAMYAGLHPEDANLIRGLALPVVLGSAFVFVTGLLNAFGAIGSPAWIHLIAPGVTALLAYFIARRVALGQPMWWIALLAVPMAAALAAASTSLMQCSKAAHREQWFRKWLAGGWFNRPAARNFFLVSLSLLVTGLVSMGSLLLVRSWIVTQENLATLGRFDAAWSISMGQAALVLASLQTYFLPALGRLRNNTSARSAEIRRVLGMACTGAALIVAALAILKPVAMALLFSNEFLPATRYLRWTLIGDYLKVTSWILSVPLIAAADMRAFLGADLTAYAAFVGGSAWLGRTVPAAEAASISFLLMYAVHLVICGLRLNRSHRFHPGIHTCLVWTAGLVLVLTVSIVYWNK